MELNTDEVTVIFVFYRFYDISVRRCARKNHSVCFQNVTVIVVEFVAVSVPLFYQILTVEFSDQCFFL